jgi:hypothetical protein
MASGEQDVRLFCSSRGRPCGSVPVVGSASDIRGRGARHSLSEREPRPSKNRRVGTPESLKARIDAPGHLFTKRSQKIR